MIKVTLLGDSIRGAYGAKVSDLLGDNFEVYQPNENCRFSKYTLRGLFAWQNEMSGSRIVHWNNGLWDICNLFGDGEFTSKTEYVENMLRIADILLARYDKVIFATTTPVTEKNPYDSNVSIKKYNDLIVPLLEEKGVIINDLHSLIAKDIDKYISKEDNIHLTEEGTRVCAKQVADIIKKVSETLDESIEKKDIFIDTTGAPV
ncbi:MAG: hypothetical protein IKC07_01780 [Clostridia bacterium]|nr:hypothetical protein [Clostridia bacterium]